MALLQVAQPALSATNVFEGGDIRCTQLKVDTSCTSSPPKPLLVFTPTVAGAYPVILFCHGYYVRHSFYSQLLRHIASHGFIVVAPLLFYKGLIPMFGPSEVKYAAKVADWIAGKLEPLLPEKVEPKLESLVVIGHSMGGKTAFALALGLAQTKLKFSVLVGLDPVAGLSKCKIFRTFPRILTGVHRSLNLKIPVAVVGAGLGLWNLIPFVVDGVNHKEFFNECKPPCGHFVVKDDGHADILDDDTPAMLNVISKCMFKKGERSQGLDEKDGGWVGGCLLEGSPERPVGGSGSHFSGS